MTPWAVVPWTCECKPAGLLRCAVHSSLCCPPVPATLQEPVPGWVVGSCSPFSFNPCLPRCPPPCPDLLPPCRPVRRHLDADEAVVLGAGLFAANLSTTFRLRQFGMADKVPYSVAIQLEGEPGEGGARVYGAWVSGCSVGGPGVVFVAAAHRYWQPSRRQHTAPCSHTSPKPAASLPARPLYCCLRAAPKTLVPALKKMPTKRGVHLHNLTADSLAFILDLDNLPGRVGRPAGGICSLGAKPAATEPVFAAVCKPGQQQFTQETACPPPPFPRTPAGAMPCCRRIFQLGSFNVSGIQTVIAKYNESGGCPACRRPLLLAAAGAGARAERPLGLHFSCAPLLVPLLAPSLTGIAKSMCPLRVPRQGEHSHQRGPERNVPCRPGRRHGGSDGSGRGAPSSSPSRRQHHH